MTIHTSADSSTCVKRWRNSAATATPTRASAMTLVSSVAFSNSSASAPLSWRSSGTTTRMARTTNKIERRRRTRAPSAEIGALGAMSRRQPSWQLRHDAGALLGAEREPARNFVEGPCAPDAQSRDRIDRAHFIAGGLDGHELSRVGRDAAGQIRIAPPKANPPLQIAK